MPPLGVGPCGALSEFTPIGFEPAGFHAAGVLHITLAVWRDRVSNAVAGVNVGCARRTKRAAGLRRTCSAMALNWKVTSVAQAHAKGDASLGTGRFWAGQCCVRGRSGDRRTPQVAEQRLDNVLGRCRSHGGDKRREGDADHAYDAAAKAGLTDQQSEALPRLTRGASPPASSLKYP